MTHNTNVAGFAALRRHFPELLAVFRFFYFAASVIWFGGSTVPIATSATGTTTLCHGSGHVLRSVTGGCQGCGGATLLCVLTYHLSLCALQRLRPTSDIAATADDSYFCDDLDPPRAAPTSPPHLDAAGAAIPAARALLPRADHELDGARSTPSSTFLVILQRRLGLFLTALTSGLDAAAAAGHPVTEYHRLGDADINDANNTARHNSTLYATY